MAFDSSEVKWKDLELFIEGTPVAKFTSLKETSEQEAEEIYGAGDEPTDIQTGNRKYALNMGVYKSVLDNMNSAAVAAGGRDMMDVPWTIVVNYKATSAAPRQTISYPNVRVTNYERGMEQNAKSMPVTLTCKCLRPIVL
jgi:hypothetical protein